MRRALALAAVAGSAIALAACGSQADTVSKNLSKEAEKFNVARRIVAINGITDKALLEITGRCSIETDGKVKSSLSVVCKEGPNKYKKYFIGLSDNVTYTVVQLQPVDVSEFRTKVIFRPENLVPDFDLTTSVNNP